MCHACSTEENAEHRFRLKTTLANQCSRLFASSDPALVCLLLSDLSVIEPRLIAAHNVSQLPLLLVEVGEIFCAHANTVLAIFLGQFVRHPAGTQLSHLQMLVYSPEWSL